MRGGKRLQSFLTIQQIQQRTANSVKSLQASIRQLNNPQSLQVNISDSLTALRDKVINN